METVPERTSHVLEDRIVEASADLDSVERGNDGLKKLRLKRETVRHLGEELFTSQGHSLWTCDMTMDKPLEK